MRLAKDEVLTLLSQISPEGQLPQIISHETGLKSLKARAFRWYWPQHDRSPLVQPPVVALTVREIWHESEDASFLGEVLPLLERHFEWLWNWRRYGNSSLLSIISPWESGMDHKPAFDRLMGRLARFPLGLYPALYIAEMRIARHSYDLGELAARGFFNVREVLFNTVFALGLEALGELLEASGQIERAERCRDRGRSVEKAILDECHDPATGLYFDVDVGSGTTLAEPGISCLMPLILGGISAERLRVLVEHLQTPGEFRLEYPVPSVPGNSPHFKPASRTYLWRGPTWMNTNWLIAEGLRRHGYGELADEISAKSRMLVEKSGFREYYNPLTGEGGGAKDFSWSALAVVM